MLRIIILVLGRVQTSNFSLPNLPRQRKICRCDLKYVTKSHWQISMAKKSEFSQICSCKARSLSNIFDKGSRYRRGKYWFAGIYKIC